jgi:glucose dehydrogenase
VTPAALAPFGVLAGLALCLPWLPSALSGAMPAEAALVRVGLAVLLGLGAARVLGGLLVSYEEAARQREDASPPAPPVDRRAG